MSAWTTSTQEQRRIGQELHDGLGQELTGLSYLAKILHQKLRAKSVSVKEAETAAELAEGIPRVLGQVQAIVKGLVPLEIGAEDLIPALQVLTANVEERTGISCRLESSPDAQVRDDGGGHPPPGPEGFGLRAAHHALPRPRHRRRAGDRTGAWRRDIRHLLPHPEITP